LNSFGVVPAQRRNLSRKRPILSPIVLKITLLLQAHMYVNVILHVSSVCKIAMDEEIPPLKHRHTKEIEVLLLPIISQHMEYII
jgi:hypothetical protein